MQLKSLEWKYFANAATGEWRGSGTGMLATIVFTITLINKSQDEYMINVNTKHIQQTKCKGLEAAKDKAQSLLTSYVLSQSIL